MKVSDVTSLARSIDLAYPTNRAISILALVVTVAGAIWCLLSGVSMPNSALWGVGAGLVLFLGWALSREIDPDHDLSAFVGAGLSLIALLLFGTPSLLVTFWLLMVLRIVIRSVGLPAKPLDSLTVLGLGLWLTWQGYWMFGIVTAAAFLLDGLLSLPLRYHLCASGLAFAATLLLSISVLDMTRETGLDAPVAIVLTMISGLFVIVIATSRQTQAVGDVTGKPLNAKRLQAAQVLALLVAIPTAWWAGTSGVMALLPLWAAMAGVGLYRLTMLLFVRGG